MKIITYLLLAACLQIPANSFSQGISLSVKNASLDSVFARIQQQSPYRFIFTNEEMQGTVKLSFTITEARIQEILRLCFKDQPLTYSMEDIYIIVRRKERKGDNQEGKGAEINVSGKVINEDGEGLPAVTVMDPDRILGTASNERGFFELKGVPSNAVLLISSMGYEEQRLPLNGRTNLLLQLKPAVNNLDELIIKGYYATSRRLNTGSVTRVSAEQIADQPVTNPVFALQGLVPGLLITQDNGLPGSRFSALIRGQNSIQNGNSPLYIIDGVPFLSDNESLTQLNGILANSPFNSIDPADIESIEVLKDADATSIYGSRGANGVILITTRKAKTEKSSLSVNFYQGWGRITRTVNLMNTAEYLQMRKEAFDNDGIIPTPVNAPDLTAWDQNRYTDFKKLFIGGTAHSTNGQLHYSAGNKQTKFSLNLGYNKQTTVFPGDFSDDKKTFDLTVNHHSGDNKFSIQISSGYAYGRSILPALDITSSINLPPNTYALTDAAGRYIWQEADYSVGNPLAELEQKNRVTSDRLTANALISYHPLPSLVFKISLGYNHISVDENIISPIASADPAFEPTGTAVQGNNLFRTWIFEPQAEYNLTVAKRLKLQTLIGSSWERNSNNRELVTGFGYTNDQLLNSLAAAASIEASSTESQYRYEAIFSRIGLDWSGKYILNLTARRDGSSRFGPQNRFADFAAAGAAWIFSEESFIKKKTSFLSFGKLRGSYGVTGNDQIGNYQYLDTYTGTTYPYQGQAGLHPARLFNGKYSWERNKKAELALEVGFLKDRLYLTVNWYRNISDNQIIRYSLPNQTGFTSVLRNFPGVVENSGMEFSFNGTIIKKEKITWNLSFNISLNRNKLLSFPGLANSSYSENYTVGKPLNAFRGLQYAGIDALTGIYLFKDVNKDGVIDNNDFGYVGTTDPEYFGGFSNTVRFGSFELSLLLEFRKQKGPHTVYSSGIAAGDIINQPAEVLDRWQNPGDSKKYEKFTQDFTNPAYNPAIYNMATSDAALTDASFIRVKNISLSYNLPSGPIRKLKMDNWRIQLQARNIATITRYKGYDPETRSGSSLPPLCEITAGMRIGF